MPYKSKHPLITLCLLYYSSPSHTLSQCSKQLQVYISSIYHFWAYKLNCTARPRCWTFKSCCAFHSLLFVFVGFFPCAEVATGVTETLECQVQKDVEVIFHGWYFYPSNSSERQKLNTDPNSTNTRYVLYYNSCICFWGWKLGFQGIQVHAQKVASEPRPFPFMRSVISCAHAECNCVWANSANGEGLGLNITWG